MTFPLNPKFPLTLGNVISVKVVHGVILLCIHLIYDVLFLPLLISMNVGFAFLRPATNFLQRNQSSTTMIS